MVTKLEKPLKREIEVDGTIYVVTLEPERLRITRIPAITPRPGRAPPPARANRRR